MILTFRAPEFKVFVLFVKFDYIFLLTWRRLQELFPNDFNDCCTLLQLQTSKSACCAAVLGCAPGIRRSGVGSVLHSQLLEDAKLKACRTIACRINSETNGLEMIVAVVQVAVLGLCY